MLWDFPEGLASVPEVAALGNKHGIQPGAINPNLFQDQEYKFGSFANPDAAVRKEALEHSKNSIAIARELRCRDISFWMADGSNYPGTANIRQRKQYMDDCFKACHAELAGDQRLLIEYKPFEPAFYHTDIADWGMALWFCKSAGNKAKVLVDTMLGGFHFNDRRYADDDLTMGSIDPYQVFRIFHEILFFEWEQGHKADIAYMIDQSHNLKGKIEAMIQTVTVAQELYAKAALVDHAALANAQKACDLVRAESILQDAFATDVRPLIRAWRLSKGLPAEPMEAFRQSGYLERISIERAARNMASASSYA